MRSVTLRRLKTGDQGTFGILATDSGQHWQSGELPDRNNQSRISCIPPGTYLCEKINSPKHGLCYQVMDVPGRGNIEIHSANWMGDESKGFKCQLLGCIALGMTQELLKGQEAVTSSKQAISEFETCMNWEPFELTITEAY